jgi:hypothetical protein
VGLLERILTRIMLLVAWPLAAKRMLDPELEEATQLAWAANATLPLDPTTAAGLVAEDLWPLSEGHDEARRQGIGSERFASLVEQSRLPPPIDELRTMMRRGHITPAQFEYALRRQRIENQWHAPLRELEEARLDPAAVANAVQQGFMHNPGLLPVSPPTGSGSVPSEPPVGLDTLAEAAAAGVDKERLTVLARLAGLPPGPFELLDMYRRGFITKDDVLRGIAEGHTKTEWGESYLKMADRPLSAAELAILVIKQWLTKEQAHARARAAGISPENLDLLISGTGRPPGPAQLQTAVNRGLIDTARFHKGIAESDVRPEWSDTLLALKVRYPTTFALRQMVATGALTPAEGERILRLEGWEPDLAAKVSHAWADAKTTRVKELAEGQVASLYEARYIDRGQAEAMLAQLGYPPAAATYLLELADARRVTRFLNTAVGKLHTLFVNHRLSEQQAVSGLGELGISSQAVDDLLATWKLERGANVPVVTPSQIASAVYYGVRERAQGVALLTARGYTEEDANLLIDVRLHGHAEPPAHLD